MHLELEHGTTIFEPYNISNSRTAATLAISSLGMFLSVLALLLLIITACLFREWRNNHKNQLLIQFMIARCLYTFVRYFYDIRALFHSECPGKQCIIYVNEITMLYSEMALVSWMCVFSIQMYNSLVVVVNAKTLNIWKVSVITWIAPIIVASTTLVLYNRLNDSDVLVYFLYLAIIKWPTLIVNGIILILILKSLTKSKKVSIGSRPKNIRLVIVLNCLIWSCSIQQLVVDIYKLTIIAFKVTSSLLLIFNISTMYHCSACVSFWVFGNESTRKMWRNKLSRRSKVPISPQPSLEPPM